MCVHIYTHTRTLAYAYVYIDARRNCLWPMGPPMPSHKIILGGICKCCKRLNPQSQKIILGR